MDDALPCDLVDELTGVVFEDPAPAGDPWPLEVAGRPAVDGIDGAGDLVD